MSADNVIRGQIVMQEMVVGQFVVPGDWAADFPNALRALANNIEMELFARGVKLPPPDTDSYGERIE